MCMKRTTIAAIVWGLLSIYCASVPASATGIGTAWGIEIGASSCYGLGTDRTCILGLSMPGIDINSYTAVYCQYPYDTQCESVSMGETVIVGFTLQRQGAPCVGHFFYEPYMDGSSFSHYCASGAWQIVDGVTSCLSTAPAPKTK